MNGTQEALAAQGVYRGRPSIRTELEALVAEGVAVADREHRTFLYELIESSSNQSD